MCAAVHCTTPLIRPLFGVGSQKVDHLVKDAVRGYFTTRGDEPGEAVGPGKKRHMETRPVRCPGFVRWLFGDSRRRNVTALSDEWLQRNGVVRVPRARRAGLAA